MKELLDKLRALESLDDIGGIADEIGTAYDDFLSGADASSAEKDKTIEDLKSEVQRLQAENYKLLTAAGATEDDEDSKQGDKSGSDDPDDEDVIENIEDVIEED